MAKHNWKNYNEAQAWVNKEFGDKTRGKTMTQRKKSKLLGAIWERARKKDKRGEF